MPQWRYAVINLLRQAAKDDLNLPEHLQAPEAWAAFLNQHYQKPWIVHFAKPTKNPKYTIKYLGRYISRPPLAMNRLKHYDGHSVVFSYLDHNTKTYREFRCEGEAFIEQLTQHIPEKHFRMIRYYGFLAHRMRSTLLPKVNELLNHSKGIIQKVCFPELLQQSFGLDPLQCILCGSQLHFSGITQACPSDGYNAITKNWHSAKKRLEYARDRSV